MGMGPELFRVHKHVGEWAKRTFGRPSPAASERQQLAAQVGFAMALVLLRRHPEYAVAIAAQEGEAADYTLREEDGRLEWASSPGPWGLSYYVDELVQNLPIEMASGE